MKMLRVLVFTIWWLNTPVFTTFNRNYIFEPYLQLQIVKVRKKKVHSNKFLKTKLLEMKRNFNINPHIKQPNKYATKTHHLPSLYL